MTVGERFQRLVGAASRRPVATLALVSVLALGGAALALSLKPSAGIDTFVSKSSVSYQATVADQRHFGQDAVIVLIHESLPDLLQTRDLATLTELEACFAGQYAVPSSTLRAFTFTTTHAPYGGAGSPCAKLARFKPAQVVYGPGTFLNRAVAAVNTQIKTLLAGVGIAVRNAQSAAYQLAIGQHLGAKRAAVAAKAAGQLAQQQQQQTLARLALSSGITALPAIDSQQFISSVVYDQIKGVNQPKSRFAYLFPTADSALIQIRLRASLSDAQQAQAISWIRQAIAMPMFGSAYHGTYTVTGVPVVLHDLASTISGSIAGLLIVVLLVMAVALLIVFRSRLRLLPLALALAAAGITFGLLAVLGATLTLASVAVLPILIGLGVDYGIQFQARAQEARRPDDPAAAGDEGPVDAETAVSRAAGRAAPTIAAAALATATGFLVLLLSPVPMVQGFGLLLVAGIVVALGCALTAGSAALVLGEREREGGVVAASVRGAGNILAPARRGAAQILSAAGAALTDAGQGAGQILSRGARPLAAPIRRSPGTRDPRWGRRRRLRGVRPVRTEGLLGAVAAHPGRVLAVAAVLAIGGWVADTQTAVQSDVTKLVPPNMPALRNLRTLEQVTGVSGEIDVTVGGANVATPSVVGWMIRYENQLLTHYGYLETRGCAYSTLCPALSLPALFSTGSPATSASSSLTQTQIDQLLTAVPTYFSQAVITPDHRAATLAFGIRLMPLARQEAVIEYMRSQLHPPAGVTAHLAGLAVLAAQADQSLSSSSHRLLTLLAGLLAVGFVLAVVFRAIGRAIVPLVPIALATGWSALILYLIGIPLNPMSATLGALVIAISTEFSVLLSERFRQERAAGHDLGAALARTYGSTGAAVLASGVTAIVGFGVLIFSNITMLRDFGFVTLVDLSVSLGGVLLVLPAVLAMSERGDLLASRRAVSDVMAAGLARLRRRPRVA